MAEAIHTEINWEPMPNGMNQQDLASETAQQMVELKRLHLSSQPSDLSFNYLQEQEHMAEAIHTEINQTDLDSDESAQQMLELTDLSSTCLQQQYVEDEVTIDVKEMIQDYGDGLLLPECCIYRVPILIRNLKEEAYTPKVVSIGPFHYNNQRLQEMERHKQILFKRFTQRAMSCLDDLVRCVKHLEPKVRASYSQAINLTEQELVKLTLTDAGFIIQLFMMFHEVEAFRKDAKLSQPWLADSILYDLMLLENQLPFFVIEELFNKAFPHDRRDGLPSFLRLAYGYFGYYNIQKLEPNPDIKIKHFTDLLRLFYLQGKISPREPFTSEARSRILLYSANALQKAGIKLKANMSKCLLDLKFSGHILEIPQILVDDETELLFRNMIALEQCHYPYDSYITDYAHVLDRLIDTYKDADLLVHKKIVNNHLGDANNVALLFNGLWENITQLNFNSEYLDICQRLNGYCEDHWHKMKATL